MFVTRFAPSPTGLLHLGHAYSALTAFDASVHAGGTFILRIEDTDTGRCRREFEVAIYEDLAWLGVTWEQPVRRQSEHMNDYSDALDRLIKLGVMYRCFKTRKDLLADIAHAPHGAVAMYRGGALAPGLEAKKIAAGDAFAWRLSLERCAAVLEARRDTVHVAPVSKQVSATALTFEKTRETPVPTLLPRPNMNNGPFTRLAERQTIDLTCEVDGLITCFDPARVGDAVLARKEFPASYHLASVWDDALAGVTHVIRGNDLADALHLHILVQALLDLPTPLYRHHRLILDEDGKRLAKRNQSVTLRALREAGNTPSDIRTRLGLPV